MNETTKSYDVAIIGGGAAGLSAAQALGRARRSVLVIDAGEPRNAPAHAMHNYLSRDGINPMEFLAVGRAELSTYSVEILADRVTDTSRGAAGFELTLAGNATVRARRVIMAGGLKDKLPNLEGLSDYWGNDVLHCPYCHGWEVRDRHIGILGGDFGFHQALMFTQWSKQITLFQQPGQELVEAELEQLQARGVTIVEEEITALLGTAGSLHAVRTAQGNEHALGALVIMPRVDVDLAAVESLGLVPSEHPMGAGRYVEVDAMGQSKVPGLWVAGSLADPRQQVVMAAANGLSVGAAVNADLTREETEADVAALRLRRAAV